MTMFSAALLGLIGAIVVAAAPLLHALLGWLAPSVALSAPIFMLAVAAVAMLIQYFIHDRGRGAMQYDGVADLMLHIHAPSAPDTATRWALRGFVSFLFSFFGGSVGAEGAAVEFGHAAAIRTRARASRWFEQRRRTDVAVTLAAGVSAAFGAPIAAVLLSIELGIGGRTLMAVISAFTAFLAVRAVFSLAGIPTFDIGGALYGFRFTSWQEWLGILFIAVAAGLVGAVVIRFFRYSREGLADIFRTRVWMRMLMAGVLLFLVALVFRSGHASAWELLEQVLWGKRTGSEAGLLLVMQVMSLALILAGFGTLGILWPLFAIGGILGYGIDQWMMGGVSGFAAVAGMAGGAALWGSVLGTPLSGAVLAFELSRNPNVLIPCFIAGLLAREIRSRLRTRSLVEQDLEVRGFSIHGGRSVVVLDAIKVGDAMVTDYDIVQERETVSALYARLMKSRYPFMPVVNAQGVYAGLLSIDVVEEAWQAQERSATSNSPLAHLLEAKDLLYRTGFRVPTVKSSDSLSVTTDIFAELPCIPVVGEDGRVDGLLFAYNVRWAYEREVIRRTRAVEWSN